MPVAPGAGVVAGPGVAAGAGSCCGGPGAAAGGAPPPPPPGVAPCGQWSVIRQCGGHAQATGGSQCARDAQGAARSQQPAHWLQRRAAPPHLATGQHARRFWTVHEAAGCFQREVGVAAESWGRVVVIQLCQSNG